MRILGIETSCDDTGIALLETDGQHFQLLSNMVASQIEVHREYGGVYPTLAKREHQKNLPVTLEKALKEAGILNSRSRTIDTITVTYGPGLSPCLWTGITFAQDLAKQWGVPLIPVNHIEGHLLIALLREDGTMPKDIFPAIALIVSGGHTQLILVKDIGSYHIVGETRDDAAGECFDKTARILGLPYPGGPEIARKAVNAPKKFGITLPRPMLHTKDYDFSFSGLKTAVLYEYQARPKQERGSKEYIQEMAAEIQQAIIDVLIHKTMRAAQEYAVQSIILGGGVSANDELRKQFAGKLSLFIPPKNLSTDNAAMIALAGYFTSQRHKDWGEVIAEPNLRIA